jgi:hypothetical protein
MILCMLKFLLKTHSVKSISISIDIMGSLLQKHQTQLQYTPRYNINIWRDDNLINSPSFESNIFGDNIIKIPSYLLNTQSDSPRSCVSSKTYLNEMPNLTVPNLIIFIPHQKGEIKRKKITYNHSNQKTLNIKKKANIKKDNLQINTDLNFRRTSDDINKQPKTTISNPKKDQIASIKIDKSKIKLVSNIHKKYITKTNNICLATYGDKHFTFCECHVFLSKQGIAPLGCFSV